jgi:predicted RNA binding protein YcfA (HicA-like mRNA interferase family)
MISNELTFSKLKSLLMDLGFSEVITREGSHTVFKNPTSDSITTPFIVTTACESKTYCRCQTNFDRKQSLRPNSIESTYQPA